MTPSFRSDESLSATSPNGTVTVSIDLVDGRPHYRVDLGGDPIVAPSPLGVQFQEGPPMQGPFEVVDTAHRTMDTTWTPVWGPDETVRNRFAEQTVQLQESSSPRRRLDVVVRAYDDGVAFRYRWPEQPNLDTLRITSEDTHFHLTADHSAWWIPDDYDNYEWVYRETPLSAIRERAAAIGYNTYLEGTHDRVPETSSKRDKPGAVNPPLTLRSPDEAYYLAIHEADLTDYAGMTLQADPEEATTLRTNLVPWPDGVKVKADVPHRTPWRVLQIADRPGALVESHLLQNLNEPCKIDDPSWIEPMTYVGIWWGMHIDRYTWDQSGVHGATTERTKAYMRFAAEHDIDAVLVEGWNEGWSSWRGDDVFDFATPYPDFDLEEVVEYGRERGVELIGHHETGGDVPTYEEQMDEAFALYERVGVSAVKTGYAGPIRPEGVHHHSQQMVNHYRRVVEFAAEHEIMIDAHEPIMGTGEERTWPNMMTREGVRGMEYNAWSTPNPPRHTVTLPFTRMLAGPLDYTPGIFNLTPKEIRPDHRVPTTLSKQLANMVVLYSPMQMAADLIEHYEGHDALEFIERLPADWSEGHVLNARIGEYVTMARRKAASEEWFVGTTTDDSKRTLEVPLDFLDSDTTYVAHIFEDTSTSDYLDAPQSYRIRRGLVTAGDVLTARMGRSGGQAVALVPADETTLDQHEPLMH